MTGQGFTSQAHSIGSKDESCQVRQACYCCPKGDGNVAGCVLIRQLLMTEVAADAVAEKKEEVGEEGGLGGATACTHRREFCTNADDHQQLG